MFLDWFWGWRVGWSWPRTGYPNPCHSNMAYLFRTFTHKLSMYMLQMLANFTFFLGHLPRHQGCFILGFSHIPGTCTSLLHMHSIFFWYIYPPNYLCTSQRFSANSTFFPGHLPGHQGCFSQGFRTSLGHVLLFYMCGTYLFRPFTHQFICLHPADALKITDFSQIFTWMQTLYFPGKFTWKPWVFFWLFCFRWILKVMLWRIWLFSQPFIWIPGSHHCHWVLGPTITFRLMQAT